jgi:hypothetical protein
MPPHQTSIVTRVLWTQSTYHGCGRQGTHYKKDSMTQVKLKSSCLFLLNGLTHSYALYNILAEQEVKFATPFFEDSFLKFLVYIFVPPYNLSSDNP